MNPIWWIYIAAIVIATRIINVLVLFFMGHIVKEAV